MNESYQKILDANKPGEMDKSLQKILGVEKLDDPALPGTRVYDLGKVIYALFPRNANISDSFDDLTGRIEPPIPQSGGVMMEHWYITTPEGETFYSILLVGDIEGWRKQIELGAKHLDLKLAKIEGDNLVVMNGPSFPLSACGFRFGQP